jgi:hypothetical protein
MQQKFVKTWAYLAVILPTLLGLTFLFNPSSFIMPDATVADIAKVVGIRDLVYSGVLLYAVLTWQKRFIGVLLIGRGATEIMDTLAILTSQGSIGTQEMVPIIFAIISFTTAYILLKKKS